MHLHVIACLDTEGILYMHVLRLRVRYSFLIFHSLFSILSLSIYIILSLALAQPIDPCHPSPCGPYSLCRTFNEHAVCTCLDLCVGAPPNCRPECIVSSDCRSNMACINQRCKDPCPGLCGINAQCQVINHNPICSCVSGHTGDPFVRCFYEERKFDFILIT